MQISSRLAYRCLLVLLATTCLWAPPAQAEEATPVSIERVAVIGNAEGMGLKISASGPVTTEAQILTGPDRLVIDLPGAMPGRELRGLRLNQGEIKAIRASLFRSNPPITRVVVDLNAPTAYRLVSTGKSVIIKLGADGRVVTNDIWPGVTIERHPTARALATVEQAPQPPLRVGFERGLLTISANKATLAEVLYQVHLKTGADIPIPSGAEQETVAIQVGPGPAKDVLASLLNGSRFNFILQSTAQDPQGIGTVILSPKSNISDEPSPSPPEAATQPTTTPDNQLAAPTTPPSPPMQPDADEPVNPPVNPEEPPQ